jgi:hypothetical protein
MKTSIILSMAMVLVCCSCDPENEVKLDEQEIQARTLIEIDKNHKILVAAYQGLSETAFKEAILTCRKSGGDKAEFIAEMYEKSNEAFEKAITQANSQASVDYFIKIPPIEGEALKSLIELLIQENSAEAYKAALTKRLKEMSASTEQWILIKKLLLGNGTTYDMPTEQVSLNFTKITYAIDIADILLDVNLSEQERTQSVEDVLDIAQIPPIPAALLLPAVQKVREAANATEAEDLYLNWLDTEVIPTTSGGLDRDIIRRKAFFEYLGGLDILINQDFNNTNQVETSIAIMKARYDLKMLSLWAAYWDMELVE